MCCMHAAADGLSLCVLCAAPECLTLASRPRCSISSPPRYLNPACATLAALLSMAHCVVQLNSYTISALPLAHHSPISSPPPASIAARTRHESKSHWQACGSREVNVRTQQSANTCKVSGWAVTSFNSARFYASMFLQPTRSMQIFPKM